METKYNFNQKELDFDKVDGLLPAIIQHYKTGKVLMLGYMNLFALNKTLETGLVTFYSRTRKRIWVKGEVSKNYLKVKSIKKDCDNDTLLILADPQGPTCHKGCESCFDNDDNEGNDCCFDNCNEQSQYEFLSKLEDLINKRKEALKSENQNDGANKTLESLSYTAKLFSCGVPRIAKKLGEEAVETVIAATKDNNNDDKEDKNDEFLEEASDLLYHYLVLLRAKDLSFDDVLLTLKKRHNGYNAYKKEHAIKKAANA